jgi:hypothetical protein
MAQHLGQLDAGVAVTEDPHVAPADATGLDADQQFASTGARGIEVADFETS